MILTVHELAKLNLTGRKGLTSGCFDLIHFYHLHYLERCRAECDFLIVGVDSDQLLTHFKQKKATISEFNRAAMVAALKCVDAVFVMRNLAEFEIAAKHADVIFKNKLELYGKPIVGADHAEVMAIPDVEELTSTTAIVNKIRRKEARKRGKRR